MNIALRVVGAALVLAAPVLSGCLLAAGAAAGAGTYAYAKGDLEATREVSLDRAFDATLGAMRELGFDIREQRHDATEGVVIAEQADGDDVRVTLERESDDVTRIDIRIGVFGDESESRMVLDEIDSRL